MSPAFKLFLFCFVIVFTERLFFWLWLWQLKNYHLKRFIDHFRTQKGKKLIFSLPNIILFLLIISLSIVYLVPREETSLYYFIIWLIAVLLFMLSLTFKTLFRVVKLRLKIPVLTKKTSLLLLIGLLFEFLIIISLFSFGENGIHLFLFFLFFSPVFFSLIVLVLQPLTVIQRKKILKKAQTKRERLKDLTVIGITGSYGKTSTKEYLSHILSKKYKVLKTEKNLNAEIGIANTILKDLNETYDFLIAEIGAYEKGKIKQVCEMIQPKIGILTGINEQHLATFGSKENIKKAKYELIEKSSLAVFNDNNEIVKNLGHKKGIRVSNNDLKDIKIDQEKVSFNYKDVFFEVNCHGKQNIENIMLAVSVSEYLGMSLPEIASILKDTEIRDIEIEKKNNIIFLKSTYSSNPTGVLADLDYLNLYEGRKTIVMPCLIELGKSSQEVHERIGKGIGKVCDLAIITTKERFKDIKKGARGSKTEVVFLQKKEEILKRLKGTVLLEGRVSKIF